MLDDLKNNLHFTTWHMVHQLPRFFINGWQSIQLKRTLDLTYRNVYFYQELWDNLKINIKQIKVPTDIYILPIINKNTLRELDISKIVNRSYSGRRTWHQTSGSTHEPFKFLRGSLKMPWNDRRYFYSANYRFLLWSGVGFKKIISNLKVAQIHTAPHPTQNYLFIHTENLRVSPQKTITELKMYGADILEGLASVLVELARIAESLPQKERPRFSYVVSFGEVLTSVERKYIEDIFKCELYNKYAMEELGVIGLECKQHNGFHINEESRIVNVVDDEGNELKPGNSGRIVITYFYNDILPFIRYDTGDYGMIYPGVCPCGLPTYKITVNGRHGYFIIVNKKRVHYMELDVVLRQFAGKIAKYQIVQSDNSEPNILILPTKDFSPSDLKDLQIKFREILGFALKIEVAKDLLYNQSGKAKIIINKPE